MSSHHEAGCCSHEESHHHHHHESVKFDWRQATAKITLVCLLLIIGLVFEPQLQGTSYHWGLYAVFTPAYLISGWGVVNTAGHNLLRGYFFDENFLMTVATLGAIAIGALPEAVSVMLFYQAGELCQTWAVHRSRNSIQSLLKIRPDAAEVETATGWQEVKPEMVSVGDVILVKPGAKIPLDGEIMTGNSQVDTSALTGESLPRRVGVGDRVLAGMINQEGVLKIRVSKLFADSSIARILELVEHASSKKAPTEKLISKLAKRYTPIVVAMSLAVALIPPLVFANASHQVWIYRALVLLVISCPCGLVISIPLGYFGGIGGAARRGILVKGATFLDALAELKTVVFDKTGTLTEGSFQVQEVVPHSPWQSTELLQLAAAAETYSNHPIAKSIRQAYGKEINRDLVADYREIPGYGVQAKVAHQNILAGNDAILHREQIVHNNCYDVTGTLVHIAIDRRYGGYIKIADAIKHDAPEIVAKLKRLGVTQVVMLTGDRHTEAEQVARLLKLDRYEAELLPEDKVIALEKLLKHSGKVAFVGDGINDAPVLARADVGIAMGGLGSDAAIETADVVLMTDAPTKVAEAIQVARQTHRIVWQNISFALLIKGLFIGLGILGVATMWEAVFADVGVALIAILNATRALNVSHY